MIIHAMDSILLSVWTRALDSSTTPQVAIEQLEADDAVAVRVSCNGPGLTAETLTQLFDGREPPQSKGVPNLAVARSILRQEGGDLELMDTGEDGSWFSMELRLVPAVAVEPAYQIGGAGNE